MKNGTWGRAVVAAPIAALLLGACSGSSHAAKGTTATSSPAQIASAVTAALGAGQPGTASSASATTKTTVAAAPAAAGPSGSVRVTQTHNGPVPPTAPPACTLFTTLAASSIVGTVRSSSAATAFGTSTCTYAGNSAQTKLSLTTVGNDTIAHAAFMQAEKAAGSAARGAFIGDEAFSYPGGITSRVGHLLVNLTGTPAPTSAALETAAAAVVKQL
jgi:hypothetical protein